MTSAKAAGSLNSGSWADLCVVLTVLTKRAVGVEPVYGYEPVANRYNKTPVAQTSVGYFTVFGAEACSDS